MISDFIRDMIHMTEGEKLVVYWPFWLVVTVVCLSIAYYMGRRRK